MRSFFNNHRDRIQMPRKDFTPMKVVVDVPLSQPGVEAMKKMNGIEFDCVAQPDYVAAPRVVESARIRDAEALLCSYPPANLDEMRSLRWIQVTSTGYRQLVGLGLTERGIRASNSRGCFDTAITEWNLAMMVMLTRDVRQMIRNQDTAAWIVADGFPAERSGGRTRRDVGLRRGSVGKRPFGSPDPARASGPCPGPEMGSKPRRDIYRLPGTGDPEGVLPHRAFTAGQTNEFLAGLDYLIVGMPLTSSTEGLIGEGELRALPNTAFVLNPARGPIIREEALIRALREGWIAGAALDTHYRYPLPPEHPLWKFPNVILTPHISGSGKSLRYPERLWDLFAQNLERLGKGQNLLNELTPADLAGNVMRR